MGKELEDFPNAADSIALADSLRRRVTDTGVAKGARTGSIDTGVRNGARIGRFVELVP
jgi:hypothetical protein